MSSPAIRLEQVSKRFPGDLLAVRDLTLEIANGEYVVLVGPSACGKTTTLRLIAGLENLTSGRVFLNGNDSTSHEPHRRGVGFVAQDAALYPHLNVEQNLLFGQPKKSVSEVVKRLGLSSLLHRLPHSLSGGQQRRVALARALSRQPRYLLLDEPLTGLDPAARLELRWELARLHRESPTTTLHVTHDQEEALALGQRVAVMRDGGLQQVDTPASLYEHPANVFVATFIGSPPMNVFPWTHEGQACLAGIRPHDIRLGAVAGADIVAVVEGVEWLGKETVLRLQGTDKEKLSLVVVCGLNEGKIGERVGLYFPRERMHCFDHAGQRSSG